MPERIGARGLGLRDLPCFGARVDARATFGQRAAA